MAQGTLPISIIFLDSIVYITRKIERYAGRECYSYLPDSKRTVSKRESINGVTTKWSGRINDDGMETGYILFGNIDQAIFEASYKGSNKVSRKLKPSEKEAVERKCHDKITTENIDTLVVGYVIRRDRNQITLSSLNNEQITIKKINIKRAILWKQKGTAICSHCVNIP